MSEIFTDKRLDKRIRAVLGHDPGDLGISEEDMQKLIAANVFIQDARGPWTAKTQNPAFYDLLARLRAIVILTREARETFRALGLVRFGGALGEIMRQLEDVSNNFGRSIGADKK